MVQWIVLKWSMFVRNATNSRSVRARAVSLIAAVQKDYEEIVVTVRNTSGARSLTIQLLL